MSEIVKYHLEVTMEGAAAPLLAVADQRDFMAYEGTEMFSETQERFHSKVRHWAWTALTRTKRCTDSWEKFTGETCIQVKLVNDPDAPPTPAEDVADGVDPTKG